MADRIPLKLTDLGSGEGEIREFAGGDTTPVASGGTGATTVEGARTNLGLANTDGLAEGSTNQWFTVARVRAVVLAGFSTAVNSAVTAADTILAAFGKLQAQITSLGSTKANINSPTFTGTVSGITKAMVGLGSVDNTADSAKSVNFAATAGKTNQADTCNNWGFASSDYNNPYFRYSDGPYIRYLLFQTSNDSTIRSLRAAGSPLYMEVSGSIGTYAVSMTPSDERLKENIVPANVDASSVIKSIRMIEYDMVRGGEGHIRLGFSADQLRTLDPLFVIAVAQPEDSPLHDLGEVLNLNNNTQIAYLTKSLQEALARLDALEAAQ